MEKITIHFLKNYKQPFTCMKYVHTHNQAFNCSSLMKKPRFTSQNIFCNKMIYESTYAARNLSLMKSFKSKMYDTFFKRTNLRYGANFLYIKCADDIEYDKLFKYFQLPDTFQSWFLLMQLHVWMCIIRVVSQHGGKISKEALIEAMWNDVETRMKQLANLKMSVKKNSLNDMNNQFRAAVISYDEGFFSDDTVLAAAVWRNLYSFNCDDPRLLENAVIYIRKQVSHLSSLNAEDLMRGKLSWLPLTSALPRFSIT